MKHSYIDRYGELDSPLHLLDPRTKIIAFTAMIIAVLSIPAGNSLTFFICFFVMFIFAGISQIPLHFIAIRTLVILPFVLLAGLAAPWRGSEGWTWLAALVYRSILSLLILILLTNTTRFVELMRGLRKMGCPRILLVNLSFLYRFLFVLTDQAMRMRQARDSRTVGRTGALKDLRTLGSMLGTLMVRSFEQADRLYQAMLSRGFAGEFPVTNPRGISWRDPAFILMVAGVIAVTIYL